jgi:hypothetical protein
MNRFLWGAAALWALGGTAADAATFRAEFSSRGYVLYSTFEKPEQCEVNVYFSFTHTDNQRQEGQSLCLFKEVPRGKDQKFCEFSHERMVDPKLAKPLTVTCKPLG